MALHINLYHEVQQQQRARQRDPLKLGILAMALIALAFAGYYVFRIGSVHEVTMRLAAAEEDWRKLEPKAKQAKTRENELNEAIRTSENLVKRVEERFYWAPVLAHIMANVPRGVQITKIHGELNADAAKGNYITITGLSSGNEPRTVAEDLRTALNDKFAASYQGVTASFKSLEDSEEPAVFNGRTVRTAHFTMDLHVIAAAPTPAPPVRTPKLAGQPAATSPQADSHP